MIRLFLGFLVQVVDIVLDGEDVLPEAHRVKAVQGGVGNEFHVFLLPLEKADHFGGRSALKQHLLADGVGRYPRPETLASERILFNLVHLLETGHDQIVAGQLVAVRRS